MGAAARTPLFDSRNPVFFLIYRQLVTANELIVTGVEKVDSPSGYKSVRDGTVYNKIGMKLGGEIRLPF